MGRVRLILTILVLQCSAVLAQENDTLVDNLADLTLTELLNYEISVASKKEEKISDAPGSITAYSSSDIEDLGYYTLRDLASITSGYSSFRGIGEISFETRGQYASGGFDNNKHLVLIDGIPFSHTRANRANAEEDLPLFFAKRVEFLKGPGSALYGISAFYGVLNVVSKDLETVGTKVETKISLGNYDFKRRVMSNVIHKTEEGASKLSIGLFAKDASRDLLGNGTTQSYNLNAVNYDDQNSLFLNFSHQISEGSFNGLGVGVIYSRKSGGLGDFWLDDQNQTYESNQIIWEQLVPYLKYNKSLGDKSTLNSYFKANISNENGYVGGYQAVSTSGREFAFSEYNVRVFDYEGLAEINYEFSEQSVLSGGMNIVSRFDPGAPNSYAYNFNQDPGLFFVTNPSFSKRSSFYNTYSLFTQFQQYFEVLSGLRFTLGARMDLGRVMDPDKGGVVNRYDQLSPRIALVQKISEKLSVKAMYGSALRAPLIKEIGLNEEFIAEYPEQANVVQDVQAETINSFEASVNYASDRVNISGTYFLNRTNDPIGRIPSGIEGENLNGNMNGFITASGFEYDMNVLLSLAMKFGANYSFAHAEQYFDTDSLRGDVYNVPTHKINGYLTFKSKVPFNYSATIISHIITNYRSGGYTPWGDFNNELMDGYSVFDLNLIAALSKSVGIELQVRNVLDSEIKTPTFFAANNLSVPFPGRSFLATVSFKM